MTNYKITIQYDGTDYNGWQKQASKANTIQWRFERIISELNKKETAVNGSGRTDAGVHSRGQVANFFLDENTDTEYVKDYINKFLRGGGSKDPIALLKGAGVDMSRKESIQSAMDVFETLLDQMEALL